MTRIKLLCNKYESEVDKEYIIKEYSKQNHMAKQGNQAGKKKNEMEYLGKEIVSKERKLI